MPIRRINFTNRKKIKRKDAKIFIHPSDNGSLTFDANLHLDRYGFPKEAKVSIEAYRQTSWMRFPFGPVSNINPPFDRSLTEFDSPEIIRFRIKVTSANKPKGVLLAEADQIQPEFHEKDKEDQFPLLSAKPDGDLENQIYKIDYSDRPILLINSKAGDWRSIARSPAFISLAYPSILREIMNRILYVEKHFDTEDVGDWRSQWLLLAINMPGVYEMPDELDKDKIDDWISEAVFAFCRHFNIKEKFSNYWTEEDDK
jgi:hypothetical protein